MVDANGCDKEICVFSDDAEKDCDLRSAMNSLVDKMEMLGMFGMFGLFDGSNVCIDYDGFNARQYTDYRSLVNRYSISVILKGYIVGPEDLCKMLGFRRGISQFMLTN